MNLKQKIFLGLALVLIFIQLFLFAPDSIEEWSRQEGARADKPKQIMTGINLYEKRLEKKDWELEAERAEAISSNKDWVLYDVSITFYGKEMEYLVKARQATIDTENSDMKIMGNVHVLTSNGFKIFSPQMRYDAQERHLKSPQLTKVVSPKDKKGSYVEFQAEMLTANINLNQILAHKNVHAVKHEKGGNMDIYSDEASFHLDTRTAQFVNDVKILYNENTVRGPLASLKYDEQRGLFSEMLISGGAVLNAKNRQANAEEMVASFIKNQIILSGNPRVVQDGDELIGEKIYLLNGGSRIKVEGAKAQIEDAAGKEK